MIDKLNKNITPKQPFNDRQTKYIKRALIIDLEDLKELKNLNWRKKQQITIPAKDYSEEWSRNRQFKITNKDKPRVNLKYLVYYTLLQIVYIDDLCSIYIVLKKKSVRYLIKIYQS